MQKISERLWEKAARQRLPLSGAFELLPVCNLQCKMCYVRKSMAQVNQEGGLLPAEFWLDCARQARDLGLLYPLLTGGEPFLRKDLRQILSGMVDMGLQVSINSNGTLIDGDTADWLGSCRPGRINITLYGSSEDTYQRLCGDGDAYRRVRRAVELLKQQDIFIKFNTSITPENVDDMEDMITYAKEMDIPLEVATYMFPPLRRDAELVGRNHRLTPEEAGYAKVKADFLQHDKEWFARQVECFSHFVPVTGEMRQRQQAGERQESHCRAGRCSFWLDWQGNLGSCGVYLTTKHSLREMDLAAAWEQVVKETNELRYCSVCANCPNFGLCHACVAMVCNETGSLDGHPEYLCKMNEAVAKYYQEFAAKM